MCICIDGMGDLDGLKPGGQIRYQHMPFLRKYVRPRSEFRCRSRKMPLEGGVWDAERRVSHGVSFRDRVSSAVARPPLDTEYTVQVRYCIQSFSVYSSAPGSCLASSRLIGNRMVAL